MTVLTRDNLCRAGMLLGVVGFLGMLLDGPMWWLILWLIGAVAWTVWAKTER